MIMDIVFFAAGFVVGLYLVKVGVLTFAQVEADVAKVVDKVKKDL